MNYSQRKHLERLMAGAPAPFDSFDLFGLRGPGTFAGLKIIESPDRPRYVLPEELMPGIPWPPGFRDDINRWSRSFLGTTNMLPFGTAYMLAGGYTVMRPEHVVQLVNFT
jgi:hypothetical protein